MSDQEQAVPEWLAEAPFFKAEEGTKSADQILADLNNAAQWMGNSLRMPGPDAPAEDIAKLQERVMEKIPGLMKTPEDPEQAGAIFAKLGKPETAEGYKLPEGVELDSAQAGEIMAWAHDADMTQSQFERYLGKYVEAGQAGAERARQEHEQSMAALKADLGAAFDVKKSEAIDFLRSNDHTPKNVVDALENDLLPADQVRWLMSLADAISPEDGDFQRQESSASSVVSPSEAVEQIDEITRRLYDPDLSPEMRKGLVTKLVRLQYMRDGQKPPPEAEVARAIA